MRYSLLPICLLFGMSFANAADEAFTRQDRLRGSITPERAWWDVRHYDLALRVFPDEKRIVGSNTIRFRTLKPGRRMQIDLQEPLSISKIVHANKELAFSREGNVYWVDFAEALPPGEEAAVQVYYGGTPKVSKSPPWQGGFTWNKDEEGKHFIATTCQGIGASIWWPNKDHGYDEPDDGMNIRVTVPESLVAVANGRLEKQEHNSDAETKTFHWRVTNPINNYCVNVNIGNYVNFSDTYRGESGELLLDYWVLKHHREKAEKQFREAPRTIEAFEHWFGPYPFPEDSYKLVDVPYSGMEHQSSVTYGNGFRNGYRGRDLSGTGIGMKFDFIIVHETAHEWFGNNVSMQDVADMWIHESFANYSENLFVEYHFSRQEGEDYVIGCRRLVRNDRPIISTYGVNQSGSGDMYYKGGNMLHTMRHIINDDEKWRDILRGLNQQFRHRTVKTRDVEAFINERAGIDFSKFFDQYLRSTNLPVLEYKLAGPQLSYRWNKVVDGFSFPVRVTVNGAPRTLTPTSTYQTLRADKDIEEFELNRNYFMKVKRL